MPQFNIAYLSDMKPYSGFKHHGIDTRLNANAMNTGETFNLYIKVYCVATAGNDNTNPITK